MKKVLLILTFFTNVLFSQGYYTLNENCLSVGVNLSKYSSDNYLRLNAGYTYKGLFDISYSRSKLFTDEDVNNYQNEYSVRVFFLNKNLFFISIGIGYINQYAKTELWKDYELEVESNNLSLELGMHLSSRIDENKYFVISLFYKHYNPTEEYKTPTIKWNETKMARALIMDLGFIINLDQISFEIGPRINIEIDRGNPLYGFNLAVSLNH